jgi:CHASE2 domain-containing sensor protein
MIQGNAAMPQAGPVAGIAVLSALSGVVKMRNLTLANRKFLPVALPALVLLAIAATASQFGAGAILSLAAAFIPPLAILAAILVVGWGLSKTGLCCTVR